MGAVLAWPSPLQAVICIRPVKDTSFVNSFLQLEDSTAMLGVLPDNVRLYLMVFVSTHFTLRSLLPA